MSIVKAVNDPARQQPSQRLVILGASNVVRGFATAVNVGRRLFPGPLDIVTASGHGRGYGVTSWVLGRRLAPILGCGIWESLALRPKIRTVTVLTDIGNDLVFGAKSEQVASWVQRCLEQLGPVSQQTIMTELPLASILKLGAFRFRVLRSLLFPRSLLTHGVALRQVQELNERVIELARTYDARLIRPAEHWYGLDPIHIRGQHQFNAWTTILSAGAAADLKLNSITADQQAWSFCCLRPQCRYLFGIKQTRRQPCRTLSDGTLISLY